MRGASASTSRTTRGSKIRGMAWRTLTAFLLALAAVAAGQTVFLVFGPAMTELPDATEYKELFIALGFAWYALTVVGRPTRG